MDRTRPSFVEDLRSVQGEVEADVSAILKLAKHQHPAQPPIETPLEGARPDNHLVHRRAARSRRSQHSRAGSKPDRQLLQNVTTRLSQETNALLTEAALRQRLKKVAPDSRQEIIEEALRDWLLQHGYLRASQIAESTE